jgi:hypothetical protein
VHIHDADVHKARELRIIPKGRCPASGDWLMMENMMPGMMWGMGLFWLLVVIVLILAGAALVKYLRAEEGRE